MYYSIGLDTIVVQYLWLAIRLIRVGLMHKGSLAEIVRKIQTYGCRSHVDSMLAY